MELFRHDHADGCYVSQAYQRTVFLLERQLLWYMTGCRRMHVEPHAVVLPWQP